MLQASLLGGVALGVLSALPIIGLANCCCAWILLGGGLASYQLQQDRSAPISFGDGALVGLLAGLIGAVVWTLVSLPINALMAPLQQGMMEQMASRSADMPPEARDFLAMLDSAPARGLAAVLGFVLKLIVCGIFGLIGGLLGTVFFRKSPPPAPEAGWPPPSSFTPPPIPPPFPPSSQL
jgi:hypothetical protein